MNIQPEPSNEDGASEVSDHIEHARLVKSEAALKQEVASLKDTTLGIEKRLTALEVKDDAAGSKVK
jgi:hypothetical protein